MGKLWASGADRRYTTMQHDAPKCSYLMIFVQGLMESEHVE